MPRKRPLGLFEGYGVEVEYMIVESETLDVRPLADEVLRAAHGRYTNTTSHDGMGWSNEFVKHVIEFQNSAPSPSLAGLHEKYQREAARINAILAPMGARLMPTSMHPWMDPARDAVIWDRRNRRIYAAYDRIFGCRTHGWANIQSAQINLPFADDREFARLHAAIRVVLPIVPALAASSPLREGALTGEMDTRIGYYRSNQRALPSIAGSIIPEHVESRRQYVDRILNPMYREIAPLDPEGTLQHEWLNSRGAIARFDRSAIELRLADIQECPLADMAVLAAICAAIRAMVDERLCGYGAQAAMPVDALANLLRLCARDAESAMIEDSAYLALFGLNSRSISAADLWAHVIETAMHAALMEPFRQALAHLASQGTLARRIVRALGGDTRRERLREVYSELCRCLGAGQQFDA